MSEISVSDLFSILTVSDSTSGRKLKVTTAESDGSDVLTNSDASGGRTVKVSVVLGAMQTLTDAATVVWDLSLGTDAKVTLGGNRTLSITNIPAGVTYGTIEVIQDAGVLRTLALPTGSVVVNDGQGVVTLTTGAGAKDILSFRYNGTEFQWTIGLNYTGV